jgi:hypothetical protein
MWSTVFAIARDILAVIGVGSIVLYIWILYTTGWFHQ